jgi:hypothetical protein
MCYAGTGFIPLDSGFYADTWQNMYMKMAVYEKEVIKV